MVSKYSSTIFELHKKKNENLRIFSNLSFSKKNFDVITLFHVLEHMPKLFEILQQLKKKLKPKGENHN